MTDLQASLQAALAGRYTLERELGRGGMASVFLARDLKHDRPVAIKALRPELAAAIGTERFLREIQIAARLHHPHILSLYDSGEAPCEPGLSVPYYVMPVIQGESLRDRLERNRQLPVEDALQIGREVADALGYAHRQGIVHRDIKPENILLENGHALVADFGIARALDAAGAGQLTATGLAIGTPRYMSPEQVEGQADLDGRSDLYSLGCVVYEMLAGRPPFTGPSLSSVMKGHLVETAPALHGLRQEIPEPVERAVSRVLAKEPSDRFATASQFSEALGSEHPIEIPARSRRVPTVVFAFALGAAFILATLWSLTHRRQAGALASPTGAMAVAVLPFSVAGSESIGYLGEGMVNLLSTKLDGAGELRSVDPRALLGFVGRQPMNPETARAVAEHFGAGLYVMGDVFEAGGRLRLDASLYDPRKGDRALAQASVEGQVTRLFELVDELATQLLAGWGGGGGGTQMDRLAAVTTSSLPALKAYLEGESALRAGNFDRAIEALQRAVAADSTFALAWYRLSVAAEWLTREDLVRAAAERAVSQSTRLPERERLLLQGMLAGRRGSVDEAEGLFRTITGTYPEDVEAWIQLAELQFHFGPIRGHSAGESRTAWERVGTLEPTLISPMVHLARVSAHEDKWGELDSLVRRIIAERRAADASPTQDSRAEELELSTLRAFALGDTAEQGRVLAELAHATDITQMLSLWEVSAFTDSLDGAVRVARLMAAPTRAERVRAVGQAAVAFLEAAQGRFERARGDLHAGTTLDRPIAGEADGVLLSAPFAEFPVPELRKSFERIAALVYPAAPSSLTGSVTFAAPGRFPQVRPYLLGLLSAQLGEEAAALKYAAEAERMGGTPLSASLGKDLARGIRAEIARRHNDPAGVLAAVDGLQPEGWYLSAVAWPFLSGSRERFLRAMALEDLGRTDEALRWYNSFDEFSTYDKLYLAPALLSQARIYERLGRREEAARSYQRFIGLWRDADSQFQPKVQEARERLRDLQRPD